MRIKGLAAICIAGIVAGFSSGTQAAFCDNYRQTSSTAGPCDNCTISFVPTGSKTYRVKASNGWKANLRWRDDSGDDVSGRGTWPQQQNAEFRIRFVKNGLNAQMRMTVVDGLDFTAKFRCIR